MQLTREEARELYVILANAHKLLMNRTDYRVEDFTKCSKTLNNLAHYADKFKVSFEASEEVVDSDNDNDKDNEKNEKGEEYAPDKSFPRT